MMSLGPQGQVNETGASPHDMASIKTKGMNELFCTKDTDWAYQDEWRLIGNAGAHCTKLKVKAVYVGFKVSDNNLLKLKRIAKKRGFKVFLMNAPRGKKKISYSQVV